MANDKPVKLIFNNDSKETKKVKFKVKYKNDKKDIITDEIDYNEHQVFEIENFEEIDKLIAVIGKEEFELQKVEEEYYYKEKDINLYAKRTNDDWVEIKYDTPTGRRYQIKIDYKDGFFIGDLCQRLTLNLKGDKKMEGLEDVSDFILDTTNLNAALDKYADKITKITVEIDDRLELSAPIRSK